jgi:hypothetical protein
LCRLAFKEPGETIQILWRALRAFFRIKGLRTLEKLNRINTLYAPRDESQVSK